MNDYDSIISAQEKEEIKIKLDIFDWLKSLEESCLIKGANHELDKPAPKTSTISNMEDY